MKISKREKCFLLFGGAAAGVALVSMYVVEPLVTFQLGVREQLRQKAGLLERQQLLAADEERYQQRVDTLRAELRSAEASHFTGDKVPLVAAEIQELLHKLGEEASITVARQNVPAPKKLDRLTQVTVELSVRGDLRAIRDFLHKVQAAPKVLTIPRISVRGAPGRGQATLVADLQIAGYIVGNDEKSPPGPTRAAARDARLARGVTR